MRFNKSNHNSDFLTSKWFWTNKLTYKFFGKKFKFYQNRFLNGTKNLWRRTTEEVDTVETLNSYHGLLPREDFPDANKILRSTVNEHPHDHPCYFFDLRRSKITKKIHFVAKKSVLDLIELCSKNVFKTSKYCLHTKCRQNISVRKVFVLKICLSCPFLEFI